MQLSILTFFLLLSVNLPQVVHIGLMLHTVQWPCAQASYESHHSYGCKRCSVQYQTGARLEQMASCIVHSPVFVHYGASARAEGECIIHLRLLLYCLSELTCTKTVFIVPHQKLLLVL